MAKKTLAFLNPFKLAQLLDSAAGSKLANVTHLSSGYFMRETSSSKQSAHLQKMELLGDIPVYISPHKSMNFTKGVIKTSDLKDMSQEESLLTCTLKMSLTVNVSLLSVTLKQLTQIHTY